MKSKITLLTICLFTFLTSCVQNSFNDEIQDIANDTNRKLPTMVDNATRLENVSVHTGKVYQYNFTLINVEKRNFDSYSFKNNQKSKLVSEIRQMSKKSGFDFFVDNNVTFSYSYKDNNGDFLLSILVKPSDYK